MGVYGTRETLDIYTYIYICILIDKPRENQNNAGPGSLRSGPTVYRGYSGQCGGSWSASRLESIILGKNAPDLVDFGAIDDALASLVQWLFCI